MELTLLLVSSQLTNISQYLPCFAFLGYHGHYSNARPSINNKHSLLQNYTTNSDSPNSYSTIRTMVASGNTWERALAEKY
jgi:hypothetical protein